MEELRERALRMFETSWEYENEVLDATISILRLRFLIGFWTGYRMALVELFPWLDLKNEVPRP